MSQQINWEQVEERARGMSNEQLVYARKDCVEAARAVGPNAFGKDEGYYYDEASVYAAELRRRGGVEGPSSEYGKALIGSPFKYRGVTYRPFEVSTPAALREGGLVKAAAMLDEYGVVAEVIAHRGTRGHKAHLFRLHVDGTVQHVLALG